MHAKFILDESRQAKLSPEQVEFYNLVSDYQVTAADILYRKSEFEENSKLIGKKGFLISVVGILLFFAFIGSGLWAMSTFISQTTTETDQTVIGTAQAVFMFITGAGILCAFYVSHIKQDLMDNVEGAFTFSEIEQDENLCAKAVEYCEKSELANDWRLNVLATRGKLFIGDVAIMERLYFKDNSEKTRLEILKRTNEISVKLHSTAPAQ